MSATRPLLTFVFLRIWGGFVIFADVQSKALTRRTVMASCHRLTSKMTRPRIPPLLSVVALGMASGSEAKRAFRHLRLRVG
jgi:hypothetical protein